MIKTNYIQQFTSLTDIIINVIPMRFKPKMLWIPFTLKKKLVLIPEEVFVVSNIVVY